MVNIAACHKTLNMREEFYLCQKLSLYMQSKMKSWHISCLNSTTLTDTNYIKPRMHRPNCMEDRIHYIRWLQEEEGCGDNYHGCQITKQMAQVTTKPRNKSNLRLNARGPHHDKFTLNISLYLRLQQRLAVKTAFFNSLQIVSVWDVCEPENRNEQKLHLSY